jgi:alkyl hydroperoxide reductase subunit F
MLDENIKSQLKNVFQGLDQDVTLYFSRTTHAKQVELLELLQELSATSSRIKLSQSDKTETPSPEFYLSVGEKKTGVRFIGIPGGHEFSSLVLAILHASGKGKMPDSLLQSRIKRIKGPIEIKTFMSLSCENCPDVVQALNLMSFIHEDFKHTVIDGEYAQDEIKKLGIQGVPSVVARGELITSGKSTLLDLIIKLENFYFFALKNKSLFNFFVSAIIFDTSPGFGLVYLILILLPEILAKFCTIFLTEKPFP